MRRLVIAIAALVASVSASAGELDGKAIVCQKESDFTRGGIAMIGFEFKNGAVIGHEIRESGTTAYVSEFGSGSEYTEAPTTISWWSIYSLNRATLSLGVGVKPQATFEWQCELSPSQELFRQSLEAHRVQIQNLIDESMKDNKI